ncbi:dynein axonemal light chain 1 [Onthophagus taurus]|uniref:dynein axonemal light chain 1 n=1 Tax=Onthophagus taurus TaxID=166361 RepID=UPI000C209289|nr:dynein light chain 1, axonemal [Onthophagus taurus]XP_022913964.1 dynein light chain 1, axonemal [Onthophagus taurus]XP_022913965.1 dynein light chain 1, axonemal [Onthophagus taurus]XP_022913967.1 dynein light chain 1, axonemal [Onthophagus taurus]XP_022913968.1 dynein light chain 1, axonemal [Onthophagus taurus]XP_022913969.1 dynein light chain 1, axonemal [Onthophagus taurus]XP_022913970.1 dynein light chain 1, axonemal [Onthophagus taurus]XP_022913971.1 dynein light chain 1, axonemal 
MSKPTTIKDAIKKWEEKHPGENIGDAQEVGFQFQFPPIEKMDNSLAALTSCTKLSLSTNMIEKIAGISSLKSLKILSLSRNYIKNFSGLEGVGDCLEQLWISYNFIEKVKGINVLRRLKVLYMSNNLVKEWGEFNKLQDLPVLEELLFVGNPLYDNMEESNWKIEATKRLPNLKKLDGEPVFHDE